MYRCIDIYTDFFIHSPRTHPCQQQLYFDSTRAKQFGSRFEDFYSVLVITYETNLVNDLIGLTHSRHELGFV